MDLPSMYGDMEADGGWWQEVVRLIGARANFARVHNVGGRCRLVLDAFRGKLLMKHVLNRYRWRHGGVHHLWFTESRGWLPGTRGPSEGGARSLCGISTTVWVQAARTELGMEIFRPMVALCTCPDCTEGTKDCTRCTHRAKIRGFEDRIVRKDIIDGKEDY
jgi:hypothetical protein